MIIKDWFYAIAVCRKYGIIWNPIRDRSNASFWFRSRDGAMLEQIIHMNPFYPNFREVFMHEVGHLWLHRTGRAKTLYKKDEVNRRFFEKESLWLSGTPLLPLLDEESLASRYSIKSMRGRANKAALIEAFKTYTSFGYRQFLKTTPSDANTITRLTDKVERCIKRISK